MFLLALVTTRLGYSRKQILGTAERRSGRDAWQILANLGVAATCGLLSTIGPQREIWLMGTVAALAEAAADTASSEAGQAAADAPYLITTWEQVPVGTNGAISLPGTLAGVAAASLVSLVCGSAGLLRQPSGIAMAVGAGILGMFADSYLGALWERRRRLTNNQVNFLSTAVAAALAMLLRLCT